ncbi:MAG: hypothetical protein AAGG72_03370 [Pseudomonadota bacterium]
MTINGKAAQLRALVLALALASLKPAIAHAQPADVEPATNEPALQTVTVDDEELLQHPLLRGERPGPTNEFDFATDALSSDTTPIIHTRPPSDVLRIISWDLATAAETGFLEQFKTIKQSWRNTFGAERTASANDLPTLDDLPADIVLLQNISTIRETRKLFPARYWNVIFSRTILAGERDGRPQRQPASVAIAHRYQRGLRITATKQLLDEATGEPVAGLAVRFANYRDIFWLVSSHVAPDCSFTSAADRNAQKTDNPCKSAQVWQEWRDELARDKARSHRTVFGGRLDGARTAAKLIRAGQVGKEARKAAAKPITQKTTKSWTEWLFGPPKIGPSQPPASPTKAATPKQDKTISCDGRMIVGARGEKLFAQLDSRLGCLARYDLSYVAPKPRPDTVTGNPADQAAASLDQTDAAPRDLTDITTD